MYVIAAPRTSTVEYLYEWALWADVKILSARLPDSLAEKPHYWSASCSCSTRRVCTQIVRIHTKVGARNCVQDRLPHQASAPDQWSTGSGASNTTTTCTSDGEGL